MYFQLVRDKFDLVLCSGLFLLTLFVYIRFAEGPAAKALEYVLMTLAAGVMTLLGIRRSNGSQQMQGADIQNVNMNPVQPTEALPYEDEETGERTVNIITTERRVDDTHNQE